MEWSINVLIEPFLYLFIFILAGSVLHSLVAGSYPYSLYYFGNVSKQIPSNLQKCDRKHNYLYVNKYPVVIRGLGVLVTGDDLWSHPIGSANEGVPSTDRLIQLC